MSTYRVIKPYVSEDFKPPLTLPIGTLLRWWEERGFYLSDPVNGYCVAVGMWPVESWNDYFEKVEVE